MIEAFLARRRHTHVKNDPFLEIAFKFLKQMRSNMAHSLYIQAQQGII